MDDSVNSLYRGRAQRTRQQEFMQRRQEAHHALRTALQTQRTCNPRQLARASAEVARCRRLLLSLSGDVPTSSDEEVGRVPLGPFGCISPRGPQPAADSSNEEYYSTSSTSSGGSSTRDLDLKAALWTEYKKRPEDVLLVFHVLAAEHSSPVTEGTADAGARASNLNRQGHDSGCPKLCEPMEQCRCSRKQARLMRRKARQEQRVARWFAAKRVAEAGADADDEGEE
ncbi:hypothetical protein B0H14DRAFT_2586091 [Mycena olivaceomarginata]|nr:hypothetical protein B0H14DRAFT_2586091 [Mycena olivaceomarginata]